ncbi:MAG: methyltransferase domain-containing protein [Roseburia sp.]|nr:methyltransferase domain-containing protein [Roseburia sp.]
MADKQEKIGKVVLDLTCYPGEDIYTDGAIEDEMLEIVKNNAPEAFPEIIEQKKSWPIFYHLSEFRPNIINWLPFKRTDRVLEIGAGCGAITGALAERAGRVTCIDLSKKRSLINAYRNRERENITIMVGNFKDIEPLLPEDFDYVLLIGVFEYGQAYIGGDTPYEDFMRICNRHRSDSGRMVIAIENKFGLKYWAGCREDHLGTYFSGLEGYREGGSARTFTRHGLENILRRAGIAEYAFYYPYPDYKFMTTIYSDRYLPRKGELCNNLRNFDRERVLLFDEKQVFDQIIEEEEFPLFSNSYLLLVGGAPEVVYAKFSNDRSRDKAIRTAIVQEPGGGLHVEKLPDTTAARGHIEDTYRAYELLSKRYEGTKVTINRCRRMGGDADAGLAFAFCNGTTLEGMLDACLTKGDMEGFERLIAEYMEWLRYNEETAGVSNVDFIFPNILIEGDRWHVIDYEWTFEKHIPAEAIAFRAFYTYMLGSESRRACGELLMGRTLGFTQERIQAGIAAEQEFQRYVGGAGASVSAMRELIGNRAYELAGMLEYCVYADSKFSAKIYIDYGEGGFSEERSVTFKDCYVEERRLSLAFDIPEGAVRLRIDPCSYVCAVELVRIAVDETPYTWDMIETNGVLQACGWLVFDNADPNLTVSVAGGGHLTVELEVLELPEALAKQLTASAARENVFSKAKRFLNL